MRGVKRTPEAGDGNRRNHLRSRPATGDGARPALGTAGLLHFHTFRLIGNKPRIGVVRNFLSRRSAPRGAQELNNISMIRATKRRFSHQFHFPGQNACQSRDCRIDNARTFAPPAKVRDSNETFSARTKIQASQSTLLASSEPICRSVSASIMVGPARSALRFGLRATKPRPLRRGMNLDIGGK